MGSTVISIVPNQVRPPQDRTDPDGARPRRPTCGRFHALTRTCFSDPTDK